MVPFPAQTFKARLLLLITVCGNEKKDCSRKDVSGRAMVDVMVEFHLLQAFWCQGEMSRPVVPLADIVEIMLCGGRRRLG